MPSWPSSARWLTPCRMGRVQLVLGDAGMGNSVLLADLVRTVTSAGMRVLPVSGKCRPGQFVTVASDRHTRVSAV
jgi:predicted ATP-dependent serine protease